MKNESKNLNLWFSIHITYKQEGRSNDTQTKDIFWGGLSSSNLITRRTDLDKKPDDYENQLKCDFGTSLTLLALLYKGLSPSERKNNLQKNGWRLLKSLRWLNRTKSDSADDFALNNLGFKFVVENISYGSCDIELGILGSADKVVTFFNDNIDFFTSFVETCVPLAFEYSCSIGDSQELFNFEHIISPDLIKETLNKSARLDKIYYSQPLMENRR